MNRWIEKYKGSFRNFKPFYWLYNFTHLGRLKQNRKLYKKYGVHKSVWQDISHKDISLQSDELPWLDRENATDSLKKHPLFNTMPEDIREQLITWPQRGYMVLSRFFSEEKISSVNENIDFLLSKKIAYYNFTGRKIMNVHEKSAEARSLFEDEKLLNLLSFILGKEVIPFQTITFINGSEQKPHSDSVHMTTEPMGHLVATWTALEDIKPGCGELEYYPGSHCLPYIMNEHINEHSGKLYMDNNRYEKYENKIQELIQSHNLKPERFLGKKGDVFIWHANLLHGGVPITNKSLTRRSMVAHYYAKDVLCYHEIRNRPTLLP